MPRVKVHASVVLSVLNSFSRRPAPGVRVIGTLLGQVAKDGTVTVSQRFRSDFPCTPAVRRPSFSFLCFLPRR